MVVPEQLLNFMSPFVLSNGQYKEVYRLICEHIHKGLGAATNASSDIKCYLTFVHDLPTGKEQGQYLALDLGGTNFRVLLVTLKGGNEQPQIQSKIFELPTEVITGPGVKLFDHIVSCLALFIKERNVGSTKLPLGFTFSFPCTQVGLSQATLVRWTKGFSSPGVVGQDVGKLLMEAIARHGDVSIDVLAILNDTTGTLMSCGHRNSDCYIGLIVGTGSNACYYEKTENCELLAPEIRKAHTHVIINCESGAFGDSGCLCFVQTEYDRQVDQTSINKTKQIFEKLVSGMYMGQVVGLVLIKAIQENRMLNDIKNKAETLNKLRDNPAFIKTRYLSEVGADTPPNFRHTKNLIKTLFHLTNPTDEDCESFHYICECVVKRSGHLCGILMSFLINKMGRPKVVVGVDGSVYRFHPKFDGYMRETMNQFIDPKYKFNIMLSEDGSGRGAALVAAVESASTKTKLK